MKCFLSFLLTFSSTYGILRLSNVGYLSLPNCENGNKFMFDDAAVKASLDPVSNLLYVSGSRCVHVVDISVPEQPYRRATEYFFDSSDGKVVDVEVCGDKVAILLESPYELTEGHVYLCDVYDASRGIYCGRYNKIRVGESPKSMKFTKDCRKLIVANEGRAGKLIDDFTDPDGTVSIIIKSLLESGTPCTRELSFEYFNDKAEEYTSRGVRWVYPGDHLNGIVTKFSQDLEPEAVAISDDDAWAYVMLPENNAVGVINLVNESWHDLYSFGAKDMSNVMMDASDRDSGPNLGNYHIKALYQPTSAMFVEAASAKYVVTANTGAMKTYTSNEHGVPSNFTDNERAKSALSNDLIDTALINSDLLSDFNTDSKLGRAYISKIDGKNCRTNLIEDVFLFGGRDFGFWNVDTQSFTYSMDDLEQQAFNTYPDVFNGDCSDPNLTPADEMDQRSDEHGPEPSVITAGKYSNAPIVAGATRNGLIYLYSFFLNTPRFESVHRLGDASAVWGNVQGTVAAGDGLISDMGMIEANVINGNTYLYVIGRATGSVSINLIQDI